MKDRRLANQPRKYRGHPDPFPPPPPTEPAWLAQAAQERPEPLPPASRVVRPTSPEEASEAVRRAILGAMAEVGAGVGELHSAPDLV